MINMTVIMVLNKLMDGVTSCQNKYINRQKKNHKIVKCKYSIKRWKDILQYVHVGRNLIEKPKVRK